MNTKLWKTVGKVAVGGAITGAQWYLNAKKNQDYRQSLADQGQPMPVIQPMDSMFPEQVMPPEQLQHQSDLLQQITESQAYQDLSPAERYTTLLEINQQLQSEAIRTLSQNLTTER